MQEPFYSNSNCPQNVIPFTATEGVAQVSRQRFVVHPTLRQQRYADLDLFRQQVEESKAGLHHQPYTNRKKQTGRYKWVFLGFSLLFFVFALVTIGIPSAIGCGFFFSSCTLLKGIIVTISTTLSLSALLMGLSLRAEKEAIASLVGKAKAHLTAIYARKQTRMGIRGFFSLIGAHRHAAIALRQMYREIHDLINDKKEETLHLVSRIATAETLHDQEKEDLLNQAIEELHDKLQHILHGFRHANVT